MRSVIIRPTIGASARYQPACPGQMSGRKGNSDQPVDDPANGGIRREPELPEHEEVAPERTPSVPEFAFSDEEPDDEVQRARVLRRQADQRGPPGGHGSRRWH